MEKVVFVGNGINRIASNYAWIDVLEDLKHILDNELTIENGQKPFPILYEEIYFRAKKLHDIEESALLDAVVIKMRSMQPNEIHRQIMNSSFQNIITTNYDYTLEKVNGTSRFKTLNTRPDKAPEKRYRITTMNTDNKKQIWHIHGDLRYRQSIVLGQAMYAKILSKINKYLESTYFHYQDHKSWLDFIFHDEVHMIGFGLDYSEIDIWFALNERVRYYHKHPEKTKNEIYFYMYTSSELNQDLISILDSYDITILYNQTEENALQFYKRILSDIE